MVETQQRDWYVSFALEGQVILPTEALNQEHALEMARAVAPAIARAIEEVLGPFADRVQASVRPIAAHHEIEDPEAVEGLPVEYKPPPPHNS